MSRITHVAETHIHNDYVTGGLALARTAGASYLVNAADPVRFDRTPVRDGDDLEMGAAMRLRVLATPGHTFTHLSYVLESDGAAVRVFTGGSLLYGSTGRPDLLGPAHTVTLARAQYASAHRLARELPEAAEIFPTHGFGSFCAATQAQARPRPSGGRSSSIPRSPPAEQMYVDDAARRARCLARVLRADGPGQHRPGRAARTCPRPRRADAAQIRRRIQAGEWVVDLRDRVAFAAGFVPGSFSFPRDGSFATYLGWAIPWGTPVTLLGETPEQVSQAQRELVRIGIDRPAAAATGGPRDWAGDEPLGTLRLVKFGELAAASEAATARPADGGPGGRMVVLDVRRRLEWDEGHIAGAVHIPFSELPGRLGEVPPGEVWVHCHSGYRAIVAASMLAADGRDVISINDEFSSAETSGLAIARP